MTPEQKSEIRWFFPETFVYAALVAAFCFAVFHYLGHPLQAMSKQHKLEYAFFALGLMIFQGFVLERLTHAIISIFHHEKKKTKAQIKASQ